MEPGQIDTSNNTKHYNHTMWPCPVQGREHDCKEELKKWRPQGRTLKGPRTYDDISSTEAR